MRAKITVAGIAAIAIALFADVLDPAVVGAVPYVGDVLDAVFLVVLFLLLRDFRVMFAVPELASLFPPLAPLEVLPFYTGTVMYVLYRQNKEARKNR